MGMVARKPAKSAAAKASVVVEDAVSLEEELRDVKLADLHPGLTQYRKHFDEARTKALAESMRRVGQLDRLIVRKRSKGGYEIVSGERRWRAAKIIKVARLRCTVRELTDEQAYEIAVIGNTQREDPHPLEECDGFVVLHDTYKRTVEQIAEKVNRPVGYVYERLALRDLGAAARTAFFADRLGLGVARLLSRVRPEKTQAEALKEILRRAEAPDRPSISYARDVIERGYMLRLADAPFDTKSAELVPKAGACTSCPKNSATQGALFAEGLGKGAMCTDGTCWDGKVKADAAIRVARARSEGKTVLDAATTKKLFPHGDQIYSNEHVGIDRPADSYAYGDDKKRSWREVLGKRLEGVPVSVAKLPSGGVVEIAKKADLVRAAKAAPLATDPGFLRPQAKGGASPAEQKRRSEQKRREAADKLARANMIRLVVGTVQELGDLNILLDLVLDAALARAQGTALARIIERRDITLEDDGKKRPTWERAMGTVERETLIRYRADLGPDERRGLIAELLCNEQHLAAPIADEDADDEGVLMGWGVLQRCARRFGIDVEHHERQAEREIEEAEDQKKHGKRKPAKAEGEPVHTTKLRGPRKKKGEPPVVQPTLAEAYAGAVESPEADDTEIPW